MPISIPKILPCDPSNGFYPVILIIKDSVLKSGSTISIKMYDPENNNTLVTEQNVTLSESMIQFVNLVFDPGRFSGNIAKVTVECNGKNIADKLCIIKRPDGSKLITDVYNVSIPGYSMMVLLWCNAYGSGYDPEWFTTGPLIVVDGKDSVKVPYMDPYVSPEYPHMGAQYDPWYEIIVYDSDGNIVGYRIMNYAEFRNEAKNGTLKITLVAYKLQVDIKFLVNASSKDDALRIVKQYVTAMFSSRAVVNIGTPTEVTSGQYSVPVTLILFAGKGYTRESPVLVIAILVAIVAICTAACIVSHEWSVAVQKQAEAEEDRVKMMTETIRDIAQYNLNETKNILKSDLPPETKAQLLMHMNHNINAVLDYAKEVEKKEQEKQNLQNQLETIKQIVLIVAVAAVVVAFMRLFR